MRMSVHHESKDWTPILLSWSSTERTQYECSFPKHPGWSSLHKKPLISAQPSKQVPWHTVGHTPRAGTQGSVCATGLHRSCSQTSQNHGIARDERDLWRVAWPHQQMLSLDNAHNENVKRKYEKSIFKTWLSCSIVNLFTVLLLTDIPEERGRGLICGVSIRLKERDWKLPGRIQKGSEDLTRDPNFCLTEKYCNGLTSTQQGSGKYSQEGRQSLHTTLKKKKGKRGN